MAEHDPVLLIHDEDAACVFFRNLCWPNKAIFCLRCRHPEVYSLRRMHYRCRKCSYEFHDFTRSRFSTVRIPMRKWASVLYCFEKEMTAIKIAEYSGICYPTTLKILSVIRQAIAVNTPYISNNIGYLGRERSHHPVFAQKKLMFCMTFTKGMAWIKQIYVFNQDVVDSHFRTTECCGTVGIIHGFYPCDLLIYNVSDSVNPINQINPTPKCSTTVEIHSFVTFLKEKSRMKRRMARDAFTLRVAEIIFRYNNRDSSLFRKAAELLSTQVDVY